MPGLKDLFGHLGPAYVQDNLDMTIEFVFDFALSAELLFVVEHDEIMPISPGVNASVQVNPPVFIKTIDSIGVKSLPFNAELIGYNSPESFGTMSNTDLNGDPIDYLDISYNNASPSDSSIQLKITGTALSHPSTYIAQIDAQGVGVFDNLISFQDSATDQVWVFEATPNNLGIGDWANTLTRTVTITLGA